MAKQKKAKSFVYYDTIWKGVGGGLSNPGESRLCKVGKHKVHSAKSSGSATLVVSEMLAKNGIETKRHKKNRP